MNTKQLNRIFARAMYSMVIVAMVFSVTGTVSAQGPEPIIKISTSNNYLRADNFSPSTIVTFTVYATQDTNEDPLWSDFRVTDGSGFAIIWPWDDPQPPDLVVGNYVIVSDGTNEKQLVLEPLTIDVFNPETDFVAGTASPGESVWIVVGNDDIGYPAGILAEANENGIWTADFADVYNFTNEMWGSAEVADDEWDVTVYHLGPTPTPWLIAFPENDAVEGWEFPEGATLSLSINDITYPDWSGVAHVTDWGDPRTYVRFDFWEDYDLQVGDMITLTDQFGQSTTHEVQYLAVTNVNPGADTVAGVANVNTVVQVWPHGYDQDFFIEYPVEDRTWFANFGALGFHAIEETGGRSQIVIDGNATAVDWHVTYPRFTVFPEWEWFDGLDWPNGATVTITVLGENGNKPECATKKESWGYFFNGSFGEGNFGEYCDVVIGDIVTFTDGTTTRTHTVQNLSVTKATHDNDTVMGMADPGAEVYVWPHATGEQKLAIAKTKGAAMGKWHVDFTETYDLTPGDCGRSEIRDENANSTAVDWCIPNPRMVASESGDWFWTTDFKPGDLDIWIYDSPDDSANLLWSGQQVADESGFAFVGSDIHELDLIPGNYLVISDGDSQKELVLQPINVTMFDTQYDFMAGFATPGSEVWAAAGPQDWQERIMINPDPDTGEWYADFAEIGFDITEDMQYWSYAHIYDEDGDANEGNVPYLANWVAAYTYDLPKDSFADNGVYPYHFELEWNFPRANTWEGQGGELVISDLASISNGYVLLRGFRELRGSGTPEGPVCDEAGDIHPDQQMRFLFGWATDYPMTYEEALAHFDSLTVRAVWSEEMSAELTRHDIMDIDSMDWPQYVCDFTEAPPPHIVASITEDWFYLLDFAPDTSFDYSVYENYGGTQLWQGSETTDDSGFAWIKADGRWDFEPGSYLVVSDGTSTKELVIEGFTFDIFNAANGQLSGTVPEQYGRNLWVGVGWEGDGWSMDVTTDENGAWIADFGQPVPSDYGWVYAQLFDDDGDATELRPASQIIFLRPACGDTYTVQPGSLLEIRYGSWVAIGEGLANQNADHLTVELVLNDVMVAGEKQPVVPRSEIPCGIPVEDAYGVYYAADIGPLDPGEYTVSVTWSFDIAVTDGYDADGDGATDWYGPGEIFTREFTLIVP